MHSRLITILVSAALATASPLEARSATGSEATIPATAGKAIGGALDPTPAAKANSPAVSPGPQFLTIQVTNKHTAAVSTSHALASGSPSPVSGNVGPGVIPTKAASSFVVPKNWAGNVAIVESKYKLTGDDSLIEANYVNSIADVDISYVDGFSVPITCSCSGKVVTGCNKDLNLSKCPSGEYDGQGACKNPYRANTTTTTATPYFKPCQGHAYTFPNDNKANSFGECQNGVISCCIGTACPANNK